MKDGKPQYAKVKVMTYEMDSIPTAHTCTFHYETPYFSSEAILRENLLKAMDNAEGIED